jgi:hypothetical protein
LHQLAGAGIVDFPEGSHDRFHVLGEEVVAQPRYFNAFLIGATLGSFAGGEDDEVNSCQVIHFFDVGHFQMAAVTEDEEGLFGIFGVEFTVGGEVQNPVVEDVFEGSEGKVAIEPFGTLEDPLGVGFGRANDRIQMER